MVWASQKFNLSSISAFHWFSGHNCKAGTSVIDGQIQTRLPFSSLVPLQSFRFVCKLDHTTKEQFVRHRTINGTTRTIIQAISISNDADIKMKRQLNLHLKSSSSIYIIQEWKIAWLVWMCLRYSALLAHSFQFLSFSDFLSQTLCI